MVSDTDTYALETRRMKFGAGVGIAISRWVGNMSIFAANLSQTYARKKEKNTTNGSVNATKNSNGNATTVSVNATKNSSKW